MSSLSRCDDGAGLEERERVAAQLLLRTERGREEYVELRSLAVYVRESDTADEDARGACLSLSRVLSVLFATALRLRRSRADCRTFASHLADARAHMRCWERARLISSLTSESASSRTGAVFSASLSSCFRRFLRQSTIPIMKRMRAMASERERANIMPVMGSEPGFPQPLGSEGAVEVAAELLPTPEDAGDAVAADTWSSWTGSSVAEASMHCVFWGGVTREKQEE